MGKYRITPSIEKLIQETCKGFPELQIYVQGKPQFRTKTIHKFWKDLTADEQKQVPRDFNRYLDQKVGNEIIKREKMIPLIIKEHVCINHVIELRKLYEQKGPKAFDEYITWINAMIDKHSMQHQKQEVPNVEEYTK